MEQVIRGGIPYDVKKSGSISGLKGADKFIVHIDDLKVTFKFVEVSGSTPGAALEAVSAKDLTIALQNFENNLATAFEATIGNSDNRPLLIALMVHSVSSTNLFQDTNRVVTYSFLLGAA